MFACLGLPPTRAVPAKQGGGARRPPLCAGGGSSQHKEAVTTAGLREPILQFNDGSPGAFGQFQLYRSQMHMTTSRVCSCEFEFGEGGKLGLGSEFEIDEPVELGLETNSYSDTHSPETVNSNSNEPGTHIKSSTSTLAYARARSGGRSPCLIRANLSTPSAGARAAARCAAGGLRFTFGWHAPEPVSHSAVGYINFLSGDPSNGSSKLIHCWRQTRTRLRVRVRQTR